jgi:hypothetical protein
MIEGALDGGACSAATGIAAEQKRALDHLQPQLGESSAAAYPLPRGVPDCRHLCS